MNEPDEEESIFVRVKASTRVADQTERFMEVARRAIKKIVACEEDYYFERILVSSGVDSSVLEELPSLVNGFFVRMMVQNGNLYITELSSGAPHSAGVFSIIFQAHTWNVRNRFDILSGAISHFGEESSGAPDMVLTVPKKYAAAGQVRQTVVVVELEVNNRSIKQMREDYVHYFDDPSLIAVVGIKFFGTNMCPAWRAAAVQWSRVAGGAINVTAVRDFGVEGMTNEGKILFEQPLEGALPGVHRGVWAENRHVPLEAEMLGALGGMSRQNAMMWIAMQDDESTLYTTSTPPRLTFNGEALAAQLRNLPENVVIQDFVLDLGGVLHKTVRVASF